MEGLFIAFILLNVYGFLLMGVDKRRAKQQKWRISERKIWLTALFGGAWGIGFGMHVFRHKTKHRSFKYGIPLIIVIQSILFFFCSEIV
ncbi:DUF1294 domain-containing protein [Fervidibacillus albus]|uniref:DUF1294 domain-containing protein n=1 Tax=Fervidibacillus albus TaxID=2980026 RepID=A0A9E8LVD5_9BACI|nr:DUF1294 domain-containing protein [Fervidibacillus albus]WAA10191.1 DUF1294 domain-containing protein [Fervidibacillus albus]